MDGALEDTVTVTFNGQDKTIGYQPHASISALLEHAKQAFGVQSNHLLGLFNQAGVELADDQSAQAAGVEPGALLVLRQSTVKGGA
jgi:hypothetical protein